MRGTSAFHGLRYFRNFPIPSLSIDVPLPPFSTPSSPRPDPSYTENFHASSRDEDYSKGAGGGGACLYLIVFSWNSRLKRNLFIFIQSLAIQVIIDEAGNLKFIELLVFMENYQIFMVSCLNTYMEYLQFELYRERERERGIHSKRIIQSFQWHLFSNLLKVMNTCEFH